jgi:hypothetical protein
MHLGPVCRRACCNLVVQAVQSDSLSPEADAYEAELRRMLGDDYVTPPPVPTRGINKPPSRETRSVFESNGLHQAHIAPCNMQHATPTAHGRHAAFRKRPTRNMGCTTAVAEARRPRPLPRLLAIQLQVNKPPGTISIINAIHCARSLAGEPGRVLVARDTGFQV